MRFTRVLLIFRGVVEVGWVKGFRMLGGGGD